MSERPAGVFGFGWLHPTRNAPIVAVMNADNPSRSAVISLLLFRQAAFSDQR
jgi:hypothetical protein